MQINHLNLPIFLICEGKTARRTVPTVTSTHLYAHTCASEKRNEREGIYVGFAPSNLTFWGFASFSLATRHSLSELDSALAARSILHFLYFLHFLHFLHFVLFCVFRSIFHSIKHIPWCRHKSAILVYFRQKNIFFCSFLNIYKIYISFLFFFFIFILYKIK